MEQFTKERCLLNRDAHILLYHDCYETDRDFTLIFCILAKLLWRFPFVSSYRAVLVRLRTQQEQDSARTIDFAEIRLARDSKI